MLHITTQKEYISWIEMVIANPFSVLPPFCDWLDEHNISSQRWREILAVLNKVVYIQTSKFKIKKKHVFFEEEEVKYPDGTSRIQRHRIIKEVEINVLQIVRMATKQDAMEISLEGKDYTLQVKHLKRMKFMTDAWFKVAGYKKVPNSSSSGDLSTLNLKQYEYKRRRYAN